MNAIKAQAVAACGAGIALGQTWMGTRLAVTPRRYFWLTLEEIERALMVEEAALLSLSSLVKARKRDLRHPPEQNALPLRESEIPDSTGGGPVRRRVSGR
ncbi:MAG: hypothetical protein U0401_19880 [Anaerolineae bacterium]